MGLIDKPNASPTDPLSSVRQSIDSFKQTIDNNHNDSFTPISQRSVFKR